ncbi:MAG: substrate-binding domain-containing protein, partial [Candidatus Eremiobacteraeota bacterium]|nr:substrate-binding domain-containing protein [Candidatus Eremiobacteraeota bacterium]
MKLEKWILILGFVLLFTVPALAAMQVVSVLYAGSLVTPMEGPIKTALSQRGIDFQGQGGGSKMLANLISAGAKQPDIFISVDPKIVLGLGSKVLDAETFASTSLGIGWSNSSKHAALFASVAAGKTSIISALSTPGLAIGRTDPRLDPKGVYTVEAMTLLAGVDGEKRILGDAENDAQIFPEEDLLARIDTGQADVGFFYRTEAVARGLNFVALPGKASMSDKITYTIAELRDAPHPDVAAKFEQFILNDEGKTILQRGGVEYLPTPLVLVKPTDH